MVYVYFGLLNQELDDLELVPLDRIEKGSLLLMVLSLEIQMIPLVKHPHCVQISIHNRMMAHTKILLFALVQEIPLFLFLVQ